VLMLEQVFVFVPVASSVFTPEGLVFMPQDLGSCVACRALGPCACS
jgi:hypothetical protein